MIFLLWLFFFLFRERGGGFSPLFIASHRLAFEEARQLHDWFFSLLLLVYFFPRLFQAPESISHNETTAKRCMAKGEVSDHGSLRKMELLCCFSSSVWHLICLVQF